VEVETAMSGDLERQIDELLAPLARIAPAERRERRSVTRRYTLVAVAVAVVLAMLAAGATWAVYKLTASPSPTPVSPRGSLACLDLVAGNADHAARVLTAHGYTIEWKFLRYEAPDGKMFTTSSPSSVAASAIVEDVDADAAGHILVFVHAADDPFAPPSTPLGCQG
jgi:hypothetical protein